MNTAFTQDKADLLKECAALYGTFPQVVQEAQQIEDWFENKSSALQSLLDRTQTLKIEEDEEEQRNTMFGIWA